MKIALITIHWANSYGGTLQALASQKVLSKYGDVTIIDYKTSHLTKSMQLIRVGYRFRDFLRMGKDLFRLLPRYRLLKQFRNFAGKYYNLTDTFHHSDELKLLDDCYDIFICGSDQIWNPDVVEGFDGAYFLDFVTNRKKISYASSAGSYQYSDKEESVLRDYLVSFSSISVRESNTACYIKTLTRRNNIATVLDPTLMLDKSEWLKMLNVEENVSRKPYVFVYTLKKNSLVRSVIKQVSDYLNLEVIVIDQDPFLGYSSDFHIQDAGPEKYIELIAGASFVITNSFHGTVFSTNFEVPFITIKPESGLNRIQSYLESVGLEERIIVDKKGLDDVVQSVVDFKEPTIKLKKLRELSKEYLDSAMDAQ